MTLCRDFNASEVYLSLHRDACAFWLPGPVLGAGDGVRKDRLVSDSGAHIPVWEVEQQTRGYQHQRASARQDFYRISEWETSPLKLGGQRRPLSEGDSSQTVKTKISTKKTLYKCYARTLLLHDKSFVGFLPKPITPVDHETT